MVAVSSEAAFSFRMDAMDKNRRERYRESDYQSAMKIAEESENPAFREAYCDQLSANGKTK